MTAPIRILGIGSPFGDDRIGWEAAQRLAGKFDPARVSVSAHDRPGVQLIALMRGAATVVLLDAVKSGAAPGTLHRLEGEAVQDAAAQHASSHGFGISEALQLAQQLGELPPRVILLGMEVGVAERADELSHAVRMALPVLLAVVADEVNLALRQQA